MAVTQEAAAGLQEPQEAEAVKPEPGLAEASRWQLEPVIMVPRAETPVTPAPALARRMPGPQGN